MFQQYTKEEFNKIIQYQVKNKFVTINNKIFTKKQKLPVIYENIVLYECIIIDNYFNI
jgi:hypothetical protein